MTPIPKVKNTNKPEELRPINMCHIVDKILQTVVKEQLEDYIDDNHLLYDKQSAYRAEHSCETALNLVLNEWLEKREQKHKIVAVFLDLSRAFETVDREILIDVLNYNGITGTVLKWFKSWLEDRTQLTNFNETLSEPLPINVGLPQGTPLASLLFIMYMNSIVNYVHNSKPNLFADDILLWIAGVDIIDSVNKINEDLQRVNTFLRMMKLKLNVNKTKFMIIGERNETISYEIMIGGQNIERVNQMKYLGVVIDDQLTFKPYCEYLEKKIAKKISFLRRIRNKLDTQTALLMYKSTIGPHYDYCSSILFLLNETKISNLQRLQNRAMRVILNERRDASVTQMLNRTKLLTVKQRINFNVIAFVYKATTGLLPPYMCNQLNLVADVQPYSLRSNNLLRLPRFVSSSGQRSILYKGVKLLNDMTNDGFGMAENLREFKALAEEYVKMKF